MPTFIFHLYKKIFFSVFFSFKVMLTEWSPGLKKHCKSASYNVKELMDFSL